MSEVSFHLIGINGFHVKAENERFTVVGLRYRQKLKIWNFTSLFGRPVAFAVMVT